ncbi:MAG: F0F1 ATP synthase subunit B [Methylacidiphilales bacterium]|nr:F0F1 ATP synthase subunit B [Candidatus Methylacidiphilales bacterium]MDW8349593.1 F0F1 ATP synthase subunit B [Verrucomicrobiae bacterium]
MDAIAEILQRLEVNWPKLIAQAVNFGLVLLILWHFAFRKIIRLLDERQQKIAESVRNAERIQQELAQAEQQRKDILSRANEQANALIAEAMKTAEAQSQRKIQEAIRSAEILIQKAKEAIELDRQKMMTELKAEIARLVVQTTAKVVSITLTEDDHRRLREEAARQLAETLR